MTLPKITTNLPYEDFATDTDLQFVDWIRQLDDPKTNNLKAEALDDITVLDVSYGSIAGLFCSSLLAELGAEVIRIEPPGGDLAREFSPFGYKHKDTGLGYLVEARNKLHMTANLETEEGQEAFRSLAAQADVVIETFKPGVMDDYGLSYRHLKEINPRLIYSTLYTYGHFGPEAGCGKASYDLIDQARSGIMALTGEDVNDEGEQPWTVPTKEGNWMGWYAGGAWTAYGILAALHHREITGTGQMVDVAPPEAEMAFADYHLLYYHTTGKVRGRVGPYDSSVFPYTIVKTKDSYSFIAGFSDVNWEGLTNIMEDPELRGQFPTIFDRLDKEKQPLIHKAIEAWSKNHTSDEILEKVQDYLLNRRGPGVVATAKMTDIQETFEDENWWDRGVFDKGTDPYYGDLALQAPVWKMSGTPGRIKWVCRPVGADNEYIYSKYLGVGKKQLAEWKSRNVI